MSGFIHIAEKPSVWRHLMRGVLVIVPLAAFGWYVLSDEGLPIAPPRPGDTVATRPAPLPAPPMRLHDDAAAADDTDARDERIAVAMPALRADTPDTDDYAARNAQVDTRRLSPTRPMAARSFLSEVLLAPDAGTGFVVAEVLPESRYERMGLKPGDVIYTLDTPRMAAVDEGSMVALMQQTELELDVYRNGTLTRLHTALNSTPEAGDAAPR